MLKNRSLYIFSGTLTLNSVVENIIFLQLLMFSKLNDEDNGYKLQFFCNNNNNNQDNVATELIPDVVRELLLGNIVVVKAISAGSGAIQITSVSSNIQSPFVIIVPVNTTDKIT